MQTNLQDYSDGMRLTASGTIADGELLYIDANGKVLPCSDVDHNPVGVADGDVVSGAEASFLPFVPGRSYWVKTAEAITVGEHVFADQTAFKTVSGTAIVTAQAKRLGVCLVAGAGAASLIKILCTQQSS